MVPDRLPCLAPGNPSVLVHSGNRWHTSGLQASDTSTARAPSHRRAHNEPPKEFAELSPTKRNEETARAWRAPAAPHTRLSASLRLMANLM